MVDRTNGLPIAMRKPRQARRGWFYINPATVDVVVGAGTSVVTLTRRQLLGALKVMDRFEANRRSEQ